MAAATSSPPPALVDLDEQFALPLSSRAIKALPQRRHKRARLAPPTHSTDGTISDGSTTGGLGGTSGGGTTTEDSNDGSPRTPPPQEVGADLRYPGGMVPIGGRIDLSQLRTNDQGEPMLSLHPDSPRTKAVIADLAADLSHNIASLNLKEQFEEFKKRAVEAASTGVRSPVEDLLKDDSYSFLNSVAAAAVATASSAANGGAPVAPASNNGRTTGSGGGTDDDFYYSDARGEQGGNKKKRKVPSTASLHVGDIHSFSTSVMSPSVAFSSASGPTPTTASTDFGAAGNPLTTVQGDENISPFSASRYATSTAAPTSEVIEYPDPETDEEDDDDEGRRGGAFGGSGTPISGRVGGFRTDLGAKMTISKGDSSPLRA